MGQNNLGRLIGRTIDNKDLSPDTGAGQALLTPLDKLTDSDFFVQRRNYNTYRDRIGTVARGHQVLY
jgi:hypothetical protein